MLFDILAVHPSKTVATICVQMPGKLFAINEIGGKARAKRCDAQMSERADRQEEK